MFELIVIYNIIKLERNIRSTNLKKHQFHNYFETIFFTKYT